VHPRQQKASPRAGLFLCSSYKGVSSLLTGAMVRDGKWMSSAQYFDAGQQSLSGKPSLLENQRCVFTTRLILLPKIIDPPNGVENNCA